MKRNNKWLIIIILLLLAVTAGVVWYLLRDKKQEDKMEANAVVGTMPGKSNEEIEAELNRQVSEKMIAFTINANPVYEDGKAKGNILFENPQSNDKYTKLEVFRDDTGDLIYETGLLEPGSYVPEAELEKPLKKGEYACTAYIHGYRISDNGYLGKVSAGIKITVQN
ncbi:hypothetical protein [Anaerolentibacter hominis]|uniref:hypothetical protein n=1 Tax=Anaerolentibacter hominis TaxID=3079009 RepID=UPI0031B80732